MATALSRNGKRLLDKKRNPPVNLPQPANPIVITGVTVAGSVLTLTFDQAVTLDGGLIPQFITSVAAATPVSAELTAPHIVAITYSAAIDAAESVTVPFRDPAIRNTSGGYVTGTQLAL